MQDGQKGPTFSPAQPHRAERAVPRRGRSEGGGDAYALAGTSRQLIVNPDAATVLPPAGGDTHALRSLSMVPAVLTGLACIAAGLFRLGFVADFLAKPSLIGEWPGKVETGNERSPKTGERVPLVTVQKPGVAPPTSSPSGGPQGRGRVGSGAI